MMRATLIAVLVAAVVAGAGLHLATGDSSDTAAAQRGGPASVATTKIMRQDLVEIETEDGTLGYADTRSTTNRLRGTVTWLPPAGRVVRTGRAVYKVDDKPVVLMHGRVPAFRALRPGVGDGTDVRQLERSLRTAGYDRGRDMSIDTSWDAATTAAVERWQDAHGLPQTGVIEPGRVVFLPGTRRIASARVSRGGVEVTTTSMRRLVTVPLDTTEADIARVGQRVTIELPSDEKVRGTITSVGKVATAAKATDPNSTAAATITVRIRLLSRTTALDLAPVTVRLERSRRKNVLAIPVTALLARPGGRFAVQLADRSRRVVAVKPGLYASGNVEIAGRGLRVGDRVVDAAVR